MGLRGRGACEKMALEGAIPKKIREKGRMRASLSFSSDLVRGVYASASVERRRSFACLARFVRRTKKKERLLVV